MLEKMIVINNLEYEVIKLLGKGKGGYSYLVKNANKYYVLKQIHHEPCSYYVFGNKIESELNDYQKLLEIGIRIPKMISIDLTKEIIIKEYIEGPTIEEIVKGGLMIDDYLFQVRKMASIAHFHNLNIDYYPANFIVNNGILYYIDYECNEYTEEWNFENWGIKYWVK